MGSLGNSQILKSYLRSMTSLSVLEALSSLVSDELFDLETGVGCKMSLLTAAPTALV